MVDAVRAGDIHRVICAAIVDHQPFDDVETIHLAGRVCQCDRQGCRFIEAGDLNYEFVHVWTGHFKAFADMAEYPASHA
jgi:hypothetical protein